MPDIIDISPTRVNADHSNAGHSVIGRMLSIACSEDGSELYAGSYSNLWTSQDGGNNWEQLSWPQPDTSQFDVPGALGGWCAIDLAVKLGWRVEKHPRFLARLTKSGYADIVGFGDCGVWTALGNGDGTFQPPRVVIANFGYLAGDWQVEKHPRFVVDLNGDGCADIVGFGDQGVWTAIGNGDGTFKAPQFVLENFGYAQDWRVDKNPRFLARLTKSGFADIVGFGTDGVWTALSNGDGTFREPNVNPVLHNFGYMQNWRVEKNPRLLADIDGDGLADIVGFGTGGVWVALSNGDGTFREPAHNPVLANFSYDQGWRVDKHPRFLADINGDGLADIVGFGDAGVYIVLSNGDGTFREPLPNPVIPDFGYEAGGWRVDKHPRFLADLTGHGQASIVGFGDAGVYVALNKDDGSGSFNYHPDPLPAISNFGYNQGWRVDRHPRFPADLKGTGQASILGFGDAGVWTAVGDGNGDFLSSNFVLSNFGYGTIVLALMAGDRRATTDGEAGSRGLWRSTDGGSNWTRVLPSSVFPSPGQLEWALGSDHLVYAAGGTCLAISGNAGQTFEEAFPAGGVNHVAVWQNSPADPFPAVMYALGSTMSLSFDGGTTWIADKGTVPPNLGGMVSPSANFNTPKVMVISSRFPLEILVAQDGSSGTDAIHRGDYSSFPFGNQTSQWDTLPLPDVLTSTDTQDSGNVFLAGTRRGAGNLLYYSVQRWYPDFWTAAAYVGPMDAQSASDWTRLGLVHCDLHGILLSPDFSASISNGKYQPHTGTMWMLSDGGIYSSKDGGFSFDPATRASTLSCLSVAGVAIPGKPPALSLNEGDNDGFYSMDGGQSWSYQDYGGGDNDCAFADPLRPNALLVFTPRWDTSGQAPPPPNQGARFGQTVSVYQAGSGKLPNAKAGPNDRHAVTGPPVVTDTKESANAWNASSGFGIRGFRPIVRGLPGEDAPDQGDYIFILLNPALLPSPSQPLLVRTQNILDIASRDEWVTTATGPGQGANVYLQGPPLPGQGLTWVQASGGHAATVFFIGGDGTLWTGTADAANWLRLVPAPAVRGKSAGASWATRFFVSPYQPSLIYLLDTDHVKRSDDGGQTWNVDLNLENQLTWNQQISISTVDDQLGVDPFDLILTDMQFDPNNPLVRFAIGAGGAFMTIDGVTWTRLLHTEAMQGRPSSCYYDSISDDTATLYVAFAGRSLVKITGLVVTTIF